MRVKDVRPLLASGVLVIGPDGRPVWPHPWEVSYVGAERRADNSLMLLELAPTRCTQCGEEYPAFDVTLPRAEAIRTFPVCPHCGHQPKSEPAFAKREPQE